MLTLRLNQIQPKVSLQHFILQVKNWRLFSFAYDQRSDSVSDSATVS